MVPNSEIHLSSGGSNGQKGILVWKCLDIELIIGSVHQLGYELGYRHILLSIKTPVRIFYSTNTFVYKMVL